MNKILVTIGVPHRWLPVHSLEQFIVQVPRRTVVDALFLTNKAKELGYDKFIIVGYVLHAAPVAQDKADNPVK